MNENKSIETLSELFVERYLEEPKNLMKIGQIAYEVKSQLSYSDYSLWVKRVLGAGVTAMENYIRFYVHLRNLPGAEKLTYYKATQLCKLLTQKDREKFLTFKGTNGELKTEIDDYIREQRQKATQTILDEAKESKEGLNAWAGRIHALAKEKGWWDEDRSFGEIIALCHSELSEALEAYREGKPHICVNKIGGLETNEVKMLKGIKPEGIAIELADCIIRILDYCGKENIDIEQSIERKHAYNKTRSHRHGGKKI